MANESDIRKLKEGDVIKWHSDSDDLSEVIESIIFDNFDNDIRAHKGDRVTINGLHWSFMDIKIVNINK